MGQLSFFLFERLRSMSTKTIVKTMILGALGVVVVVQLGARNVPGAKQLSNLMR